MIVPTWLSVAALYCLTKSMMAIPWGPSAVPTGGAGVALPAGIWIFTTAATCFLAMGLYLFVRPAPRPPVRRRGRSMRPVAPLGARCGLSRPSARERPPSMPGRRPATKGGPGRSEPSDLAELQLDRGLPAEDVHEDL